VKGKEEQGLQGQQFENGCLVLYVLDLPAVLEVLSFLAHTPARLPASAHLKATHYVGYR